MKNLFGRYFVIVIVCLLGMAGCNGKRDASQPRKITIAQFGDFFLYAPLYIAIDKGYFAEQGLDVSLLSTGGDDKTWAAVLSGNAAFGVADPTFVAIAGAKGQPGRVVANIVNGVPFWGITYRDDIPVITSPQQLKNYTVATFPAPSTAYTLQSRMYKEANVAPKIREGAFGTLLALVQAGQADIALELEPNVSQAARGGAHVLYSMKELYGPFAITGLTATPATIQNDPELVKGIVCALQKSLDFIHQNQSTSIQLLSKRFPDLSQDVASSALARIVKEDIIPQSLVTSSDAWSKAVQLRIDMGDLSKDANLSSYTVNQFAESVQGDPTCRLP